MIYCILLDIFQEGYIPGTYVDGSEDRIISIKCSCKKWVSRNGHLMLTSISTLQTKDAGYMHQLPHKPVSILTPAKQPPKNWKGQWYTCILAKQCSCNYNQHWIAAAKQLFGKGTRYNATNRNGCKSSGRLIQREKHYTNCNLYIFSQ